MSDVLESGQPTDYLVDVPSFISRLRAGSFTSPSGTKSSFFFDSLSRTRGKKASAHEVVDSDDTIIQDMGSGLQVFAMAVYFAGQSCDLDADIFYNSLYERYTPDAPGILNHPRWGDVTVIPFGEPEQSEDYITGAGISRVSVVFRETKSTAVPSSFGFSASSITDAANKMDESALDRASRIVADTKASYSKVKAVVRGKVRAITGFIDGVSDLVIDIQDEVDALTQDLYAAIDEAATPVILLAQVGNIMRTIASVPVQGSAMVKAYMELAGDIIDGFSSDFNNANTSIDLQNIALSLQYVGSSAIASMALAELSATYTTRDELGDSIDLLTEKYAEYIAQLDIATASLSTGIKNLFAPDHDTGSYLHGIVYDTQSTLINRAFALKSRRTYRLSAPSDPLTETWTHYGDLGMLGFYCKTNKITRDEFIELAAGRVLAVYV